MRMTVGRIEPSRGGRADALEDRALMSDVLRSLPANTRRPGLRRPRRSARSRGGAPRRKEPRSDGITPLPGPRELPPGLSSEVRG